MSDSSLCTGRVWRTALDGWVFGHSGKLRQRLRISQPVFARYLNTSESTVEKWETGAKQPSGMALKLLSIVEKHGLEALS
jgi:DNA-binding transcriptional regulator YiaG